MSPPARATNRPRPTRRRLLKFGSARHMGRAVRAMARIRPPFAVRRAVCNRRHARLQVLQVSLLVRIASHT